MACLAPFSFAGPNPPACNPPQSAFGARITGWTQIAEHQHGKPNPQNFTIYATHQPPAANEFMIFYGRDQANLRLGSAPTAGMAIEVHPQLHREITYGTGTDRRGEKVLNLPAGVAGIQDFLNRLSTWPTCKISPMTVTPGGQPTSVSISEWVGQNRAPTACGGWNFLRDGTVSHPNLMIDLNDPALNDDDELYDPQFTVTAQYLLSTTVGLMQYGIRNHNYSNDLGKVMRLEYDFGAPGNHLFQQVLNPAVSLQVGTALAKYHLYETREFEVTCQDTCDQGVLIARIEATLQDYNGSSVYPQQVFSDLHLFSEDSTIWGVSQTP